MHFKSALHLPDFPLSPALMLVTWRYRDRNSIVQHFDTRAWIIFYTCFLFSILQFWDLRYLAFFLVIAVLSLILSRIQIREMYRALIFIVGFITVFTFLTFLTGRGGMEVYTEEHVIKTLSASFSIFGWTPTLTITVEEEEAIRISHEVAERPVAPTAAKDRRPKKAKKRQRGNTQ